MNLRRPFLAALLGLATLAPLTSLPVQAQPAPVSLLNVSYDHGIRNVDPGLIEMGRSYGLSRWGLYTQIILPGALSSILVGLRFSLGLMWVILIVAETISAQAGIGYLTMNAREFLQTDVVLVGILLYALLGKLADVFARALERFWLR